MCSLAHTWNFKLVYNRTIYIFHFTVLKDTLEKKGVLGHLKARIRAEVFSALDDDHEPRPSLSHENLLINELIREYLEFNKYKYTASVLIAGKWLFISEENLCFILFLILRKQPKYVVLLLCHASDWTHSVLWSLVSMNKFWWALCCRGK